VDRIETIVETLENGDVSLEEAEELHEEGQTLLEALQDDLMSAMAQSSNSEQTSLQLAVSFSFRVNRGRDLVSRR